MNFIYFTAMILGINNLHIIRLKNNVLNSNSKSIRSFFSGQEINKFIILSPSLQNSVDRPAPPFGCCLYFLNSSLIHHTSALWFRFSMETQRCIRLYMSLMVVTLLICFPANYFLVHALSSEVSSTEQLVFNHSVFMEELCDGGAWNCYLKLVRCCHFITVCYL